MLALAFTAELTFSASIVVTPNCVYVPMTRDTVGAYVPLPAVCVSVVSVAHALQVALSVEVRLAIVNPLIALVPPAAPLHGHTFQFRSRRNNRLTVFQTCCPACTLSAKKPAVEPSRLS